MSLIDAGSSSSFSSVTGIVDRIFDEKFELGLSKFRGFLRSLINRQTLLSLLPLALWWMIFQLNIYVPFELRPTIHLRLLPVLEQAIFGNQGTSLSSSNYKLIKFKFD